MKIIMRIKKKKKNKTKKILKIKTKKILKIIKQIMMPKKAIIMKRQKMK